VSVLVVGCGAIGLGARCRGETAQMTFSFQNIEQAKTKLNGCDTSVFIDIGSSFRSFTRELKVNAFRHIRDLTLTFEHPVTVIAGTNTIGKTSLLLLLACSHEQFMKLDSTSPSPSMRAHAWKDVLSFTAHETVDTDYSYEMKWRVGRKNLSGTGKRLASSAAWSGLGKKSSDAKRTNAKIRDREVRLVDLERVLPGRSFTRALMEKANSATAVRLDPEIEQAFAYVFGLVSVEISEVGGHINKRCFLVQESGRSYSTYNAASGQESVIYLLKDLIESPNDSLILIDEVEAGFHPSVQRKLADVIQYVSWRDKKQFIVTTHSPTLLSAFPAKSRRFIETTSAGYRVIAGISHQAARSKMDSTGYPLVRLYCADDLAAYLVKKALVRIGQSHPYASRLVNIVTSGTIDQVKNDYERHKRNYLQYTNRIGYCAVFDGDHKDHPHYSGYLGNPAERAVFLYPYEAPEKFLVRSFLNDHPHAELRSALEHGDHHSLFQAMVNFGLAADTADARSQCYVSFQGASEYTKHDADLQEFLTNVLTEFSYMPD